jgi:molybdate transport system substrate-binding protein
VRIVGLFPDASHPPIVYPAALVAAASPNPAASGYLAFLQSPRAGVIFRRYGFIVLARRPIVPQAARTIGRN